MNMVEEMDKRDGRNFLYVVGPHFDGPLKIGRSNNVRKRTSTHRVSNPEEVYLLAVGSPWTETFINQKLGVSYFYDYQNVHQAEKDVQKMLTDYKIRGEWFNICIEDVEDLSAELFSSLVCEGVGWTHTMKPEENS